MAYRRDPPLCSLCSTVQSIFILSCRATRALGGEGGTHDLRPLSSTGSLNEYLTGELLLRPSQLRCEVPVRRRKPQARPAWCALQAYMALSSPGRRVEPRLHTHRMVLSHRHQGCPAGCFQASFSLDDVHRLAFKVSGSSTSLICSLNDSVTFCNYFSLSNFSVPVLSSFLTGFTSLWRFAVCS